MHIKVDKFQGGNLRKYIRYIHFIIVQQGLKLSFRGDILSSVPFDMVQLDKFSFTLYLSFRRNQKQESSFLQVGDLVKINISVYGEFLFLFVYSEWRSTSEACRIQKTFIKGFSYRFFLLVLQFYDTTEGGSSIFDLSGKGFSTLSK